MKGIGYSQWFPNTSLIISKLQHMNPGEDEVYPYLLKAAVITFSAEMEYELKKTFKSLLLRYLNWKLNCFQHGLNGISELYSDRADITSRNTIKLDEMIKILQDGLNKYKNLRNPKISDISEVCKYIDIPKPDLGSQWESTYNNVINARNIMAHEPTGSTTVSLQELINAVYVGEKIIAYFNIVVYFWNIDTISMKK